MKKIGDPIEHFRARRERELFDHRFSVRAEEAQKEVLRLIEQAERREELARQVSAEMDEFLKDSTRIAARIFGSIEEKEARVIEVRVAREMQEFFDDVAKKVQGLVEALLDRELAPTQLGSALDRLLQSSKEEIEKAACTAAKETEE